MTAQFQLISEVERAIALTSAGRRGEMLLHITDLFITESDRFSDEEIALFDDVFIRLAADIEGSVRASLAHRLAPMKRAPINIIRELATDDEIVIAAPILMQSERLDEETLVRIARAKSQSHLLAMSERKILSEAVTEVLVERGNRHVVLNTVKNSGAKFSKLGFSRLVARANGDDALASCVGARGDIPYDLFVSLLAAASEKVRTKLLAEAPDARSEIERAVLTATNALHKAVGSKNFGARAFVGTTDEIDRFNDDAIRALAETRKIGEAIGAVAALCQVPLVVIERAMSQEQWQTLLVFAKAAQLSRPTTKALLSLCGHQRLASSGGLEQCLASFDRLTLPTARRIIEFYRTQANKTGRKN